MMDHTERILDAMEAHLVRSLLKTAALVWALVVPWCVGVIVSL